MAALLARARDQDPRIIEFVSLQDLKGSQYFGGTYDKLKHIADFDWDLLVIDEAHEGVDTTKTDSPSTRSSARRTLHLSGTPFKALASGKFADDEIFNWTYEDEQTARREWADDGQDNPYAALPTLNLLTYQLSRMITDRLAEGVAIDEDEANVDYTFDLTSSSHQGQRLLRVRSRRRQVPRLPGDATRSTRSPPRSSGTRSGTRSGCSTASPPPRRWSGCSRRTRSSRTTRSSSPPATGPPLTRRRLTRSDAR